MKRRRTFYSNGMRPPILLVVPFIVIYGLMTFCLWSLQFRFSATPSEISNMGEIVNIRMGLLGGAAGIYALYRLCRFHPALNRRYADWLKLSPWTADKPLPLGPILPVWQDGVVIGALTAIAYWHAHINPWLPAVVFGMVYILGMTLLLALTRRWAHFCVLAFIWPTLILPELANWQIAALFAGIIAVIWLGHRRSLQTFPWRHLNNSQKPAVSLLQKDIRINLGGPVTVGNANAAGWPFQVLSPNIRFSSISRRKSAIISLLFGWWTYCLIKQSAIEPLPAMMLVFAFFAVMFRLAIYCSRVTPPFNVFGRISSGRIIVPGFDQVFLTPIATVLIAIFGAAIIKCSGTWYAAAEAVVVGLMWFSLFAGGPRLQKWMLTGQHRFNPPRHTEAQRESLRSV